MKFPLPALALTALLLPNLSPAALTEWETALGTGTAPAVKYVSGVDGPAISGLLPQLLDVGDLSEARSFEFIVYAGNAGVSSALMGLTGVQYLKFEQYMNTGHPGMTTPGVLDYDSEAPAPLYRNVHMVFTSDGIDTILYIDGIPAHTFSGVPLALSGSVGVGSVSNPAGDAFNDRLDGHILGFASYDEALPPAEVLAHHTAYQAGATTVHLPSWRNALTSSGVTPSTTVFSPVSGLAPITVNLGELTGPRTFEFVFQAGETGGSESLLGRSPVQALKFDQWQDTGMFGLTDVGVADHTAAAPSLYHEVLHAAYVFNGTSTDLYVNSELLHTFENIPLQLTGTVGLGGTASITGETQEIVYSDPLDGSVLRFASYDEALTETTVAAHHAAFALDGGAQEFSAWANAVNSGSPATVVLEPVSGSSQSSVDVGPLTGARTFEFIVNAGLARGSTALMGGNQQALKYEQWQDTGNFGITTYTVADHISGAAAPEMVDTHVVFSSDGIDTQLYVDGVLQHTFAGVALVSQGLQGLATAAVVPVYSATYGDPLDGHVLGFASYSAALSAAEIAAHYTALVQGGAEAPVLDFRITGISRNPTSGALSLTWNSAETGSYRIEYSEDPANFTGVAANNLPAIPGGSSTHTFPAPSPAERLFFRVVKL